jgi:hypothetical protein
MLTTQGFQFDLTNANENFRVQIVQEAGTTIRRLLNTANMGNDIRAADLTIIEKAMMFVPLNWPLTMIFLEDACVDVSDHSCSRI